MTQFLVILLILLAVLFIYKTFTYKELLKKLKDTISQKESIINEQKKTVSNLKHELFVMTRDFNSCDDKRNRLEQIIKEKDTLYESLKLENENDLNYLALIYADHEVLQYDLSCKYFYNSNSSRDKGIRLRVNEMKTLTKNYIEQFKKMEYKYAYLLSIFPELEHFTEDIKSLKEFRDENTLSLNEVQETFDRVRQYLTKEEFTKLSEDERNQLALDRYINRNKSNWQIGRDFEMYIGYFYSQKGFAIEYYGIENTINDLGRDIIATNQDSILVIQCKYWSKEKQIHEKHIAQLYGTTIQYILSKKPDKKVTPILITNTQLSPMAKEFSSYLNVEIIENMPIGEYPRIKCNLNKDEDGFVTKIYHLPFDQQYDRTKICKKGEFYAFNVPEATAKGFRRAKKFFGN